MGLRSEKLRKMQSVYEVVTEYVNPVAISEDVAQDDWCHALSGR